MSVFDRLQKWKDRWLNQLDFFTGTMFEIFYILFLLFLVPVWLIYMFYLAVKHGEKLAEVFENRPSG